MKRGWQDVANNLAAITTSQRSGDQLKAKFADIKSRTKKKCGKQIVNVFVLCEFLFIVYEKILC